METYAHKVCYYETDKMGIVHNSNYLRWFEEARIDWMEKLGICYTEMEEKELFSPVLSVRCEYKHPMRFGDTAFIEVTLTRMTSVRLFVTYAVKNTDGVLCAVGETEHCFVNGVGQPVSIKKISPEYFEAFFAGIDRDNG